MLIRTGLAGMVGLGMCGMVASSRADVTVTGSNGTPIDPSNYTIEWDSGWATVNIVSRYSSGNSVFEVHGTKGGGGNGMKIAGVGVSVATDNDLGTTIVVRVLEDEPGGIEDVGFVYRFGSEITLVNRIVVSGPLGHVEADAIGDIEVDGDVVGPLVANGDDSTPKINSVWSRNGSIFANMIVADRPDTVEELVGSIKAPNGTIGANGGDRITVLSAGHVGAMQAKEIYADIISTGTGVHGRFYELIASDGPFMGSIYVDSLQNYSVQIPSRYSCIGDMDADITTVAGNLAEPLVITGGDFPIGRTLSVTSLSDNHGAIQITEDGATGDGGHLFGELLFSGSIGPGHDIEIDNGLCGLVRIGKSLIGDIIVNGTPGQTSEGLVGQVVVNAEHSTSSWTGAVTVDTTP